MSARREAFVTLVDGEAYTRWYRQHVFPAHQRFARLHGRPLVVLEGRLPDCGVAHPHPSWDKLRVFEAEATRPFERLCWLDADLFTMRGAPDPFAQAEEGWVAVDNDTYGSPAQAAQDREWSWFLPPGEAPPWLVNTGFFVVERERHAAVLGAVFRHWGGRWDQGPFSFHLHAAPPGKKASPVFNRVVLHHLARFGHGPGALRSLVDPPPASSTSSARRWWAARCTCRTWPPPTPRTSARGGRWRRGSSRRWRPGASSAGSWTPRSAPPPGGPWRPAARGLRLRRLARALTRTPRLLVTPHRSVEAGWVCVDVASGARLEEKFTRGELFPARDAREALGAGRGLEAVRLEHLVERLPEPERPGLLDAAARALRPGGRLTVLAATPVLDAPEAFARAANRRLHLEAGGLGSLARAVGLPGARVSGEGAPRSHEVLTWSRPS